MSGSVKRPVDPAVLEALRAAGKAGLLTAGIVAATGKLERHISKHLKRGVDQGLVAWWPDTDGAANNRRRWWLTEFAPAVKPQGTPKLIPISVQSHGKHWRAPMATVATGPIPGVQRLPGWTHDDRFQCAPGEIPQGAGFASMGVGRYLED